MIRCSKRVPIAKSHQVLYIYSAKSTAALVQLSGWVYMIDWGGPPSQRVWSKYVSPTQRTLWLRWVLGSGTNRVSVNLQPLHSSFSIQSMIDQSQIPSSPRRSSISSNTIFQWSTVSPGGWINITHTYDWLIMDRWHVPLKTAEFP